MKRRLFLLLFLIIIGLQAQPDTLTVFFGGDLMVHKPQLSSAQINQNSYDFSESFLFLKTLFARADFVILNLETTISERKFSGYPRFVSPPALIRDARKAGINVLMTANNHSADRGYYGLRTTLDYLNKYKIKHTGTFRSKNERKTNNVLIINKKGIKLAILNYTYGINNLPYPQPGIINLIDTLRMKRDIQNARLLNPDEIIVFLHWGTQYRTKPDRFQKQIRRFLQKQGIRIIIGSHPHVVEPAIYANDNLTAFSLGNFLSNQRTFPRDGSIILYVKWIKTANKIRIAETGYIPVWVYKYIQGNKTHFEILPVDEFIRFKAYFLSDKDFQKMLRFNLYVNRMMRDSGLHRGLEFIPVSQLPHLKQYGINKAGRPEARFTR